MNRYPVLYRRLFDSVGASTWTMQGWPKTAGVTTDPHIVGCACGQDWWCGVVWCGVVVRCTVVRCGVVWFVPGCMNTESIPRVLMSAMILGPMPGCACAHVSVSEVMAQLCTCNPTLPSYAPFTIGTHELQTLTYTHPTLHPNLPSPVTQTIHTSSPGDTTRSTTSTGSPGISSRVLKAFSAWPVVYLPAVCGIESTIARASTGASDFCLLCPSPVPQHTLG